MQFTTSLIALLSVSSQVLAAPLLATPTLAPQSGSVVATIDSAVSSLAGSIHANALSVAGTAVNDVKSSVAPSIESNIGDIITAVKEATSVIVPAVKDAATTLVASEVKTLLGDLATVKTIVEDIVTIVNSTIPAVLFDTTVLVEAEVATLKALIAPLVEPILAFATAVAGEKTTVTTAVPEVQGLVGDIKTIVGGLAAPVQIAEII